MKLHYPTTLLAALFLFANLSWSAQAAAANVEIKSVAEVEISTTAKDGSKEVKRVPAKKVLPGTEVIYTNTFSNSTNKPINNVAITNPVPEHMLYTGSGAVDSNIVITFSADGGKAYAAADKLLVVTADGKLRAAQAEDYTHIRWVYQGELGAGQSGAVSFRAKVK